jgi:SAM-dependent methyltransferase
MPAYVRLLAYFSNFILLASFLGIGLGCLLAASGLPSRSSGEKNASVGWRLIDWFPGLLLAVIVAVDRLRLEVAVPSTSSLYFTSGTTAPVVPVESTLLLPLLFVAVAALFVAAAHRMGRAFERRAPLTAYVSNLLGSLSGVAAFAAISWLELPPVVWFGVVAVAALAVMADGRRIVTAVNVVLLAAMLIVVYRMQGGSLWSPYYRITVFQDRSDTIVEVNHIFHQSMAPVSQKEYFYQWPYTVFGDSLDEVLVLGAGSGTDVAAALRHGARHVDAVDIDPVILRLGAERHPDKPYSDPRVTVICDDGRHFLRTTRKKYDLVVFALIDSLTVQSSFSGVRLESYMFTKESFEAVRDHLSPRGVMVLYNYFREKWLVDRLANTAASVFGHDPIGHVHQDRAYLAVMLAGPRAAELAAPPTLPADVNAYGQPHAPSPARQLVRDASVVPATDDWPFLYLERPGLPRHYVASLGLVLAVSALAVWVTLRFLKRGLTPLPTDGGQTPLPTDRGQTPLPAHGGQTPLPAHGGQTPLLRDGGQTPRARAPWSWHFFFLGAGFMLLETKSIVQFALLWGSTWSSASLAIASVLVMALGSALIAGRTPIRRRGLVAVALLALIALNYAVPVGRVAFDTRIAESLFYGALVFSPVFCAGLLFSSSFKESASTATDFGANLLGAMVGGVCEYLSLVAGYQFLLVLVAACYLAAIAAGGLRHEKVA